MKQTVFHSPESSKGREMALFGGNRVCWYVSSPGDEPDRCCCSAGGSGGGGNTWPADRAAAAVAAAAAAAGKKKGL